MATNILTISNPNFENECKKIHDSFEDFNQLIPFLTSRTQHERQQIRETYKAIYGEDFRSLLQKYESGFSPMTYSALSMLILDPHERDAIVSMEALEQDVTNFKVLVEIFVGRKSSHILLIKQAYQKLFRRQLDQDIINLEPPHPYQKILVALSTSHKSHHVDVSQHIAKCDARRLYETGEGGRGAIEEAVVLEILSKRSIPQLKLTISSYKHIYGHAYSKSLKRGNYGEFEKALKMMVKCISDPPNHYAKILYTSIKGATSQKATLVQVLVSRAEVDMDEIQRLFKKKYGKELIDVICESIPCGDYKDFLVSLAARTTSTVLLQK
ncbi:Annexin [Quillaja saponaria]|uniref:Annexin n=1 Tax=Quillaja saponaria TaxID=32244 RepID=A0AAD7PZA1_QUISA|nr:Annexin [Quillaja saponaria]